MSGRRLRELGSTRRSELHCVHEMAVGDYAEWRRRHRLSPHPTCIVLSESLDLPLQALSERPHGPILVITGARPDAHQRSRCASAGVELVTVSGPQVSGEDIGRLLKERSLQTLYSIGGPQILYTLASARLLDRLYVTIALRLIAGVQFDTLLRGEILQPPLDTRLIELHLDPSEGTKPSYLFATLDTVP
jgi:riboflavin biosynthesis pyrimidine reductase